MGYGNGSNSYYENDEAIFQIFHTMADSEGGTLFHCQEGKDRTGVISALLLLLL
ncbi:tyrosine-protein phosphatase [Acetatifactor aquisgranensis]|uniref:tyrosine-protein phosphatase n=1 Tax=Acetatifactor aquisgranensis TaxID=2941233 RepID=UPI0038CC0AA4